MLLPNNDKSNQRKQRIKGAPGSPVLRARCFRCRGPGLRAKPRARKPPGREKGKQAPPPAGSVAHPSIHLSPTEKILRVQGRRSPEKPGLGPSSLPRAHSRPHWLLAGRRQQGPWSPAQRSAAVGVSATRSCPALRDPVDSRTLCPWDFPDKNTGVGCHFLFQRIFPTRGSNLHLPPCRQTLYH